MAMGEFSLDSTPSWDIEEINEYARKKMLDKQIKTEHVALHPIWLSEPLKGAKNELLNEVGKWSTKLNGYMVAFEDIKLEKQIGAINEDHPWAHIDIKATFYTYKPCVGQKLKGVIKKLGYKASSCTIFNSMHATVFPKDDEELKSWNIGEEINFKVESFIHRKRGPIIKGKSRKKKKRSTSMSVSELSEDCS